MPTHFQTLLLEEMPRLRGYAMKLARNPTAVDDLLQQTALNAWRSQAQFALGTNFRAWLYCILRNEFLNSCRRAKNTPLPLEDVSDSVQGYDGGQEEKVVAGEVRAAMEYLPRSQRDALYLKYVGDYTYDEAAAALECSVGTIKSRLWRARLALRGIVLGNAAAGAAAGSMRTQ